MRIRWITLGVACALLLAGCDWTSYMYNAAHTGASADTSINVADLSHGLTEKWQAALGDPVTPDVSGAAVVAGGLVYVATQGGTLEAFAADGGTNCDTGAPKFCQPVWKSAQLFTGFASTPAVSNGVVYIGGTAGALLAFDAAGVQNCVSGTQVICGPLWASSTVGEIVSSPVVVNGKVFIGSSDGSVYAFDAAGQASCSASHICSPLLTFAAGASVDSSPAVANNVLYAGNDSGKLSAFDATGAQKCNAAHVCQPLWTATTGAFLHSPAVAGGKVFIGSEDHKLYAFDAAGQTGCTGSPVVCAPLWSATSANAIRSSPAVAKGVVYIGTNDGEAQVKAYDAAGVTNCSGVPKSCQPLWASTQLGLFAVSPISVANGAVYIEVQFGLTSLDGTVYAFDATAPSAQCSGTPKACTPLTGMSATVTDNADTSPTIANGFVYFAGDELHAFGK